MLAVQRYETSAGSSNWLRLTEAALSEQHESPRLQAYMDGRLLMPIPNILLWLAGALVVLGGTLTATLKIGRAHV